MRPKDLFLALLVVTVWGLNFIFISFALRTMTPLVFGTLRFFFTSLPAVFFLPRPRVDLKLIAGYGITTFAFQFAFLFTAMKMGLSAGLAALILQLQAFITIGLSALAFKDYPRKSQLIGAAISLSGIALVGLASDAQTTTLGILLALFAATSWASGNVFAKKIGRQNPLSLVAWGNLWALPVSLALAFAIETPSAFLATFLRLDALTVWSLAYVVVISSYLGYSLWNILLQKYPAATIAPFSLLVPIVGFAASSLWLGELYPLWKFEATVLVIGGLAFNIFTSKKTATQKTK